ncbi:Cytochrome b5 reductase 4 [Mactra antiquata]
MGCASSSPKKWIPDQAVEDMDSQSGLKPGQASFPSLGSQQRISTSSQGGRNKVQLKPGHSLMDWIRLGRSGKDLTSVGGVHMNVTPEELLKHNTEKDCWIALRGKVYNVTPYLDFHPGGVDELMRGAGKDATALFDEIHKWVNAESMLEKCLVGKLQMDTPILKGSQMRKGSKSSLEASKNGTLPPTFLAPPSPSQQKPRFDWYQSNKTVSVVVYTKWTEMKDEFVVIDKGDKSLLVTLYIQQSIFYVHIELEKEVSDKYTVNISGDSGKVEILFEKVTPDIQWPSIGKYLDKHQLYIPDKDYNPAFRDCTIEKIDSVTMDTNLYTICLPQGCRMKVPTGYHVHIKHTIDGMEIVRSYTAVVPHLSKQDIDSRWTDGSIIYLMIKIYKDGAFTPWLHSLNPGDLISISCYEGKFEESILKSCRHLVMFAAGTGFTPMTGLIYKYIIQQDIDTQRSAKLMFFNKTESDILWRDQLSALSDINKRFTVTHCLSDADEKWEGLRGRVNKQMVEDTLSAVDKENVLICACGPTPFTKSVIQFADELGYKGKTHAFLG